MVYINRYCIYGFIILWKSCALPTWQWFVFTRRIVCVCVNLYLPVDLWTHVRVNISYSCNLGLLIAAALFTFPEQRAATNPSVIITNVSTTVPFTIWSKCWVWSHCKQSSVVRSCSFLAFNLINPMSLPLFSRSYITFKLYQFYCVTDENGFVNTADFQLYWYNTYSRNSVIGINWGSSLYVLLGILSVTHTVYIQYKKVT